ncbi:hypothetical protein LSCM1_08070 [Leishmania martiniquensis]|uniref:Uncharacterized protein n=1 Tax=Leishmania martiniquensis TaxID=1580590 RepID=A0A836I0C1_9TRYP|nr:hypothetical protein LSCM1_08070 [Leishmania martiniquensis]
MHTSATNGRLMFSLKAAAVEATAPVPASSTTIAVDGLSENDASARTDAASAIAGVNVSCRPLTPSDAKAIAQDTMKASAPPLVAAALTSEAALTELLVTCLDRIHRLEENQARGEVQQSTLDGSLQALLTHKHEHGQQQQQQQSCDQVALDAHRGHSVRDANSSGVPSHELSGQHHRSRQINSCRTSLASHMNQASSIDGDGCTDITHRDHSHDRAAAAASEMHSEQRCRRHRQPQHPHVSGMYTMHSAEAPAPSRSAMPVDASAAAVTATGSAMDVSGKDDNHTSHSTSSRHRHLHHPGAVAASGAALPLSPADLANTKWKEASSGAGVGVGGGCARAAPSTVAAGSRHHTPTAPAAVASGGTIEPPMMANFGTSTSGVGRQRQGSLVTVVSPTHASQPEEAAAHVTAVTVPARPQVSSGNLTAATSEVIGADVNSTPASATLMSGFTWAVPMTLFSSSESSDCSTPTEYHTTARPPSQQQHRPTSSAAAEETEEERSLSIRPFAEGGDGAIYDGPDAASPVRPQRRGSRRHLRSSLTQLPPPDDSPRQQQARPHPHPPHRRGAERESRESTSPPRVAPAALRSVGSTAASSSVHTADELDALYLALSAPHSSASFLASSGSAAGSGGGATGTPPRKVQFPSGTDNDTAISELFAQTVQNTLEATNMRDNFAALVRSVHEEREKRRRLQRRVGSAVETLFRRILAMSSVVSRLQRSVRRLELEASRGGATDAADWHPQHSSRCRRCDADSQRRSGVSDRDEDGLSCDGDIGGGEGDWRERSCASFSAGSVALPRIRRGSSCRRRRSIDGHAESAGYAALAAPFPSSASASVGVERATPVGRSPWLSPPTTRCPADGARGEAALGRGRAAAVVGIASTAPAAPSGFSFERLAAATPVTAAPAVSVGALLLTGSTVLPKIISSNSSLQSFITTSAIITATAPSRAASTTLVPQTAMSPWANVPRQELSPSSLLPPPAMLHVWQAESRSSAVICESPVAPTLSITDMQLGMELPLHASATEDEPSALTDAGRVSAGTRTESMSSRATPDGNVSGGSCSKQRLQVCDAYHDNEKVRKPQEPRGAQQHLAPQEQQRRQDISGGSSAPSLPRSPTSSGLHRRKRNGQRATSAAVAISAVPISVAGGAHCSLSSARHPPPPPPQPATPSRKSLTPASAGKSSPAAGQALPDVLGTPEKGAARRTSSGSTSVSARRLLDALHSGHRSSAATEAGGAVSVATEDSDARVDGTSCVVARGGRSALGAKGHSGGSGTSAVNTTTSANADSSAAPLAPPRATLISSSSAASLARRISNTATATTPTATGPRLRQQRRGTGVAKASPGRRAARQHRSAFVSPAAATPRSSADAGARRDDMIGGGGGTDAMLEMDEGRVAEPTSAGSADGAAFKGCANLPAWRNAVICVSPTHSSSDRSPSSHPPQSLLSSWLQSPPIRVATAAGGDDKAVLQSPVTPNGINAITAGGEGQRHCSTDAHRPNSGSSSTASTPSRRSNAQQAHTPATAASVAVGGASLSTPSPPLQVAQSIFPVAVARHPQQLLLQTAAASHRARKWTSIHLKSSATVSGTLPCVPMAASMPSATSFLRITPILLSPCMARPPSAASPSAAGSSASTGACIAGSGATASRHPALFAKPLSPLTPASRPDHHPHPSPALHLSPSPSLSSNTTMSASIAAPCMPPPSLSQGHPPMLTPDVSSSAAVQSQRAAVLPRCAITAFMQTTASTLPSLVLSHPSSSRSPHLTTSNASRRVKPAASASVAAPTSSQPARPIGKAETAAMTAVTPDKTQRTISSAKVCGKAKQRTLPSPLTAHHPSSYSRQLAAVSGNRGQQLPTPSLTRGSYSSRRARAGLPPPLSVETLSDASVSAMRTSSVGTTESTEAEPNIGAGGMGGDTDGLAMHDQGEGSCTVPASLSAGAVPGRSGAYSTQLQPLRWTAKDEENGDRDPSTPPTATVPSSPLTPTAVRNADVRGAAYSVNRSSGTYGAVLDTGAGADGGDVNVDAVSDDVNSSSNKRVPPRSLWQPPQPQRRPLVGDVDAAEEPPARFSFLFDASTPVSMLSSALLRPLQRRLPATDGGGARLDIIHDASSHDCTTSSAHTSAPTARSPSDKRSV